MIGGSRPLLMLVSVSLHIFPPSEPTATFYVWADLSSLPAPLNDCLVFLEECIKRKIICVVSSLESGGFDK